MSHSYNYVIAQLEANPVRGERLNVGLIVFNPDGLSVYAARNLEKVRAISAAIDRGMVEQALGNLTVLYKNLLSDDFESVNDRVDALRRISPVTFSTPGKFFADSTESYDNSVHRLLEQLVEPEPPRQTAKRERKSALLSAIKNAFRSEKILAKKGENIDSHRVLVNKELAEGLNADLLLKNGSMHVTQTVDASHIDRARRAIQEIGISSLVFEQAKINFGLNCTVPRLVYSANAQLESAISPALHAAEHQGAELINWESRDDRIRFIVEMSSLAEPDSNQSKVNFGRVNASPKNFRDLN